MAEWVFDGVPDEKQLLRNLARKQAAELNKLRLLLREAAPVVCSNCCPSVWVTADHPNGPPHHETCKAITAALGQED